jgi:hypothetical protein
VRSSTAILAVSALLTFAPYAEAQDILRDPTRPYSARSVAAPAGGSKGGSSTYRVTAIFTSDVRRVAVVNGQRVIEGDQVDGATVVEILADSLRLNHRGKVITRRVLPNGFRS